MEPFVRWIWFTALSCLVMGGEVWCDCTDTDIHIAGGNYTLSRGLTVGSMLIYRCPEDYYPYPELSHVCEINNKWVPEPRSQKCNLVHCPDPNRLQYGMVSPGLPKYSVHNVTTFDCFSGYTLRGSARRVCLPNGKWSGSTTICSNDRGNNCPDPGIPPGASRSGHVRIGDKIKYSCIGGGLFLMGSRERVCLENGQWTGIEPACYYKHTYDTALEVSRAFGSAIRDTLTTLHPTDDDQEGRRIRISKSGILNIYIAVDISESITKEEFHEARLAVRKLIQKISSFSVTPNYEILFFSSEIHEVVNILDFYNGKVKPATMLTDLDNFEIQHRSTGTNLAQVFKKFLEQMAFIKLQTGEEGFKEHRHAIIVFTDGAYNMGGSPEPSVRRIKSMVYMNNDIEAGAKLRDEFLDIYVFGIGARIYDDDLMPLTAGKDGDHYFRMKKQNLQKTFDEMIDESDVQGLCGLHKDYETDIDSKRNMYPWFAFIIIQNEGKIRKCFGSLVTPTFILTAAHCFTFEDRAEHITVEIDDGAGKIKEVEKYTTHPKYNINGRKKEGVNEFYDYDVALIQLKEYVEISSTVRPICIPCTKETRDALKLVDGSTCREQEQLLLKDNLEALSFLTRTENLVDVKDVHAKLGPSRADCIKQARHAPGITATDEKLAVTENFLCTGGLSPFRDHIACSGDSGGAVFRNYEQRTIQIAIVSWGTDNICSGGGVQESLDNSRDFHINLFKVLPFLKSILGNKDQTVYTPLEFLPS